MGYTPDEFAALVREHQAMVFRTLVRILGGREHVEDLAQEVFLRLFRALPHFQRRAQLSTYLYRIVINVARDERKRRQRPFNQGVSLSDPIAGWEERLPHAAPPADVVVEQRELWIAVQEGLQQLGEAERTALILYHQEDCSYEQIAQVLDLPIGTVRTHLHRGREKLGRFVRDRMTHHAL